MINANGIKWVVHVSVQSLTENPSIQRQGIQNRGTKDREYKTGNKRQGIQDRDARQGIKGGEYKRQSQADTFRIKSVTPLQHYLLFSPTLFVIRPRCNSIGKNRLITN